MVLLNTGNFPEIKFCMIVYQTEIWMTKVFTIQPEGTTANCQVKLSSHSKMTVYIVFKSS